MAINVVVGALVQLLRVSDLAFFYVQQSKSVTGVAMGYPHTWFLDFVFVFQKLVIHGCRKQAISNQDPAWVIYITLQYRNNI